AEYALECSITKVFGTESLDFVVDEGVQIHGGCGFIQEYEIERMYRDSRINRIFEGTNEINRLLIPGTLVRKAMKGELPLLQAAQKLQEELFTMTPPNFEGKSPLEVEEHLLKMAKKVFLMVAGTAVQKYQMKLEEQQEILANVADLIMEVFAMESALLRTLKSFQSKGEQAAKTKIDMTKVYINDAFTRIEVIARETLAAIEEGDILRTQLSVLKKLTRSQPINTIAIKRSIAERIIKEEKYII
ncbi:MAG: acyl-CoA dehydrogenase family protein, partial [Bacilli bacterium]